MLAQQGGGAAGSLVQQAYKNGNQLKQMTKVGLWISHV